MKRSVKAISLLMAATMSLSLLPAAAMATDIPSVQSESKLLYSGECGDNASYTLTEDGVLTVTGTGKAWGGSAWKAFTEQGESYGDDYTDYNTVVNRLVLEEGITEISPETFANFLALTEISLPSTLTRIGEGAFSNCPSLQKVTVPATVTKVDASAFYKCKGLTEVVYASDAVISGFAFFGCTALEKLTVTGNPARIDDYAFSDCTSLTEVKLPDTLTFFGEGVFSGCTTLESIELPKAMTWLNRFVFADCEKLKSVDLQAITYIDEGAFKGCAALTDIYYPGSRETWSKVRIGSGNDTLKAAKLHPYHNYTYLPFATVTTKYTKYGYTGKAIEPTVTVTTVAGTKLKKGLNYTVSYKNNVQLGTATVTVTGIGKYTGEIVYKFSIVPAKPRDLKATKITDGTCTLTWTRDPSAEKYRVSFGSVLKGETEDGSYTLTKLKASSYQVYIRAIMTGTDENGEPVTYYGNATTVKIS